MCISDFTMIYDFGHRENLLKALVNDCRAEIAMLTSEVTSSGYFYGFMQESV